MFEDKCRSCGARIFWGQTRNGKQMPVDFGSNPFGNLAVSVPSDPREPVDIRVLKKGEEPGTLRYTSHFATCPNADQHRKT